MKKIFRSWGSARKACCRRKTHLQVERLDDRTVPSTFSVSSVADSGLGSLRQAILDANNTPGDDTIAVSVTGTINLAGALPSLSTNIDIEGPGANLLTVQQEKWTYPNFYRIFTVPSGATVTLSGLTISKGWRTQGADISNSGTLTVNNATISGGWNGGNAVGGGIYNDGTLTLNSSTVIGNNGDSGGGIYNDGMLALNNSTVSANVGDGGGIYNDGTATLNNSTISNNSTVWGGGGGVLNGGTLHTRNTIIAGNTFDSDIGLLPDDLAGDLGSLGHNLIGNTSGGSGFRTDLGDKLNVDPLLGPLQDNGGPTFTYALLPGSPALDAGDNKDAPLFDQRGFARIVNGTIDIGAYELQSQVSTASTTTSLSSSLNPSVYGQTVTFTATVAAASPGVGTPTGTVTFKEGAIVLGTGTLSNGQTQFTTSSLDAGTPWITAVYNGDTKFSSSTSSALSQTVNPASTTISLASWPNPADYGWTVAFTAIVTAVSPGAGTPTGSVTFKDGTIILGVVAVSGQTTFTTSTLAVGSHTITAVYNPDYNFSGSTSSSWTQTVTPASASTVGDAGFEQVSVGAGQFQYDPTGSAWAFSGGAGISGNNSGFTAGNPPAPEGMQVAFLQGTGSFSQTVANWAAGSYTLSFKAAQRGNHQASLQDFNVLVDGVVAGTFTPSGTSYQSYTTTGFTVTAGAHTIKFQGLDSAGGDNTAFVDQVAIS